MRAAVILAIFPAVTLFGGERMNVSVCNLGRLPASLIARAEAEADIVFRAMDVDVVWAKCRDEVATGETALGLRFIVRLRNDGAPKTSGRASLDTMGRAFVSAPGDGYVADIFYKGLQEFAEQHQADEDGLLGHVMAHELGHLLLGPGHSPHGLMRAFWNGGDAVAVKQRWLKFTPAEQARIRRNLHERNLAQPAGQ